MIEPAGGHCEAITYSPVGGLGPVIVLRPAGGSRGNTGMGSAPYYKSVLSLDAPPAAPTYPR